MESLVQISHEDADLLVINKPAGLVCHPTKTGVYSRLVSRVRLHLERRAAEGGVPVHLVNRLDRETSGVVVIATNDDVARELRRIWEARLAHKEYLAIVHGRVRADHELVDGALGRDEQSVVAIKDCVRPDGAPAQTEFWVMRRFRRAEGDFSLL